MDGGAGGGGGGADDEDLLSTPSVLVVGALLSLLIFLSIAGNVLVCVAIYTERSLRRIGNLFLASLAVADLFVAALVMTFAVANDLLGYWLFGDTLCDTWIAFDVMCSTASILNLCAISLDRYIHIKDPLRYGRWVTRRVALASITAVWLLAALVSFVPISLGLHRPAEDQSAAAASSDEPPTCALDLAPVYAVVSSCVSFYCPTLVMLGIYCRLYLYAQKHVKNIRAVTRPLSANFDCAGASPSHKAPLAHAQSSPYHVSDHKAAITVGVIMGVFLVCWVPFFCVNIVAAFCKTCIPGIAFKVLTWLGYSNSAFNPIIYSIFNKEFRDAFRRILTANAAHIPCCACCACCPAKCGYEAVSSRSSLAAQGQRRSKASVDCGALGGGPQRRGNGACPADAVTPRSSAGSAAPALAPAAPSPAAPSPVALSPVTRSRAPSYPAAPSSASAPASVCASPTAPGPAAPPPPPPPHTPHTPPPQAQPRLAETCVLCTERDPEEAISAI